jgi:hypothetical protein
MLQGPWRKHHRASTARLKVHGKMTLQRCMLGVVTRWAAPRGVDFSMLLRRIADGTVVACLATSGCGFGHLDGLAGGGGIGPSADAGGTRGEDAAAVGSGGSSGSDDDASTDARASAGSSDDATGAGGFAEEAGVPTDQDAPEAAVDASDVLDAPAPQEAAPDACTFETNEQLCARVWKNCGPLIAPDRCGLSRQVDCGPCAAPQICGGTDTLNVCSGGGPYNRARGGTATASVPPVKVDQSPHQAFDSSIITKWFCTVPTAWIAYQFNAGAKFAINTYTVTSADDKPERDPRDWDLEGSNDGSSWVLLDRRVNQWFVNRHQTNTYSFANTTPYSNIRFVVKANAGGTQLQVAEIQLFDLPPSFLGAAGY